MDRAVQSRVVSYDLAEVIDPQSKGRDRASALSVV